MLATEVAGDGVTVNSVQPGTHHTARAAALAGSLDEMAAAIPAGRLGDPGDFGAVVAFLCSEQAGFVTGAGLHIDGARSAGSSESGEGSRTPSVAWKAIALPLSYARAAATHRAGAVYPSACATCLRAGRGGSSRCPPAS